MKEMKSYGHSRKTRVPPIAGTTVKVCGKCNLWFAARPRFRVCDGCQRHAILAVRRSPALIDSEPTTNRQLPEKAENGQLSVNNPRSIGGVLALEAAEWDYRHGKSFGCSRPAEQQAEILSCDQGRRHPFEGARPEWSGYCLGCSCRCHIGQGMSAETKAMITTRNVREGLQA